MFSKSKPYRCRDCGYVLSLNKPTNKCPQCGSIYLLPQNMQAVRLPKKMTVTLSERFLSLILGAVSGLLTFFIWGIAILVKGGPSAGKAAAGAMYVGLKLSLVISLSVGLAGFIWGGERLANLLGILWGTDREFNEKLDEKIGSIVCIIPMWLVYSALMLVIVGSFGYLAAKL